MQAAKSVRWFTGGKLLGRLELSCLQCLVLKFLSLTDSIWRDLGGLLDCWSQSSNEIRWRDFFPLAGTAFLIFAGYFCTAEPIPGEQSQVRSRLLRSTFFSGRIGNRSCWACPDISIALVLFRLRLMLDLEPAQRVVLI